MNVIAQVTICCSYMSMGKLLSVNQLLNIKNSAVIAVAYFTIYPVTVCGFTVKK